MAKPQNLQQQVIRNTDTKQARQENYLSEIFPSFSAFLLFSSFVFVSSSVLCLFITTAVVFVLFCRLCQFLQG
jgi:hypothetical protein